MKEDTPMRDANAQAEAARGYVDSMLQTPGMFAGPSVQCFEVALYNVMAFWVTVTNLDVDPRVVMRRTYLARFGSSAGAGGPASRLIERFGDDVDHEEILGFYAAFADAVFAHTREACPPLSETAVDVPALTRSINLGKLAAEMEARGDDEA